MMRSVIFLALGLLVGAAGALLFRDSFLPPPDSIEGKAAGLETSLARANRRIAALEAVSQNSNQSMLGPGVSSIVDDFREGRPVDINDVFQTAKPVLRDLAPVFDAIRRRALKREFEAMSANLSERYNLNASQQKALKKWLEEKSEAEAKEFRDLALRDGTGIEDLAKAAREARHDEGLDEFMERTLSGDELARFKDDRLNQKLARVQGEADRKVERLNQIVALDEKQQDQIFGLMARSSRDFDPSMKLDGIGEDKTTLSPGQSRDEAILAVLRPDQRQKYDEHRAQKRRRVEEDMNEIGLKLPANWDFFEDE